MKASTHRKKERIAILENGNKVGYNACTPDGPKEYNRDIFTYIGKGHIFSINGVLKTGETEYYFYKSNVQPVPDLIVNQNNGYNSHKGDVLL